MKLLHILLGLLIRWPDKPDERLTMHRYGTINTDLVAANQCKDKGWSHYEYQVSITCFNKLNKDGYLIDNRAINKALQDATRQVASCEQMCLHYADALEELFKYNEVPLCNLHMSLKPVVPGAQTKDWAEFELTRDYRRSSQ